LSLEIDGYWLGKIWPGVIADGLGGGGPVLMAPPATSPLLA
jgi:hypothetical protein